MSYEVGSSSTGGGSPAADPNHNQINVTNAATLIVALNALRATVTIHNDDTTTLFVGGSGVTVANGHRIPAGGAYTWSHEKGALYGIYAVDPGTTTVSFYEESA